jgi:hypothetical protein
MSANATSDRSNENIVSPSPNPAETHKRIQMGLFSFEVVSIGGNENDADEGGGGTGMEKSLMFSVLH